MQKYRGAMDLTSLLFFGGLWYTNIKMSMISGMDVAKQLVKRSKRFEKLICGTKRIHAERAQR